MNRIISAFALMLAVAGCRTAPQTSNRLDFMTSPHPVTQSGANSKAFILARPGGGAYLAWAGKDGDRSQVFVSVTRNGRQFSAPVAVSQPDRTLDLGAENGPQLALAEDGTLYVVWIAGTPVTASPVRGKHPPRPGNLNVWLSASRDGGRSFSAPQKINDDTGGAEHRFATVAVDRRRVVVAWLDKRGEDESRPDFARVYMAASGDGSRTFSANVDATRGQTNGICHCCKLGLALSARGGWGIAFRNAIGDLRDIYLVTNANDSPVNIDNSHWIMPGCPMNGPTLAFDAADRLHATWLTGGIVPGISSDRHKVLYRVLSPNGRWNEPVVVGTGTHPRLAVTPGGAAFVIWEDEGIRLATVSGGRQLQVSDPEEAAAFPSISVSRNGVIYAAWHQWDADDNPQVWVAAIRQ